VSGLLLIFNIKSYETPHTDATLVLVLEIEFHGSSGVEKAVYYTQRAVALSLTWQPRHDQIIMIH